MTEPDDTTTDGDTDDHAGPSGDIGERVARLETQVAALRRHLEAERDGRDRERTDGRSKTSDVDDPSRVTRRGVLTAGGVLAALGLGAAPASADPQGQVGTKSDPVERLYARDVLASTVGTASNPVAEGHVDAINADELSIVDDDATFTVGAGGDFSSINGALETLSRKRTEFSSDGVRVELRLLGGFTMTEQVFVEDGLDLRWIRLTAEDSEVPIDRSALSEAFFDYHRDRYPAFGAKNCAGLPVIDALFRMDSSGPGGGRDGVFLTQQSAVHVTGNGGVKNAGSRGLYALRDCLVNCESGTYNTNSATFSGSGDDNVVSLHNNVLNVQRVDARDAGRRGLFVNGSSTVNARRINVSAAGDEGIRAHRAAAVDAYQAAINGCGTNGVYAQNGCRLNLNDCRVSWSGNAGIHAEKGCVVAVADATVEDCGGPNAVTARGSFVNLAGTRVTDADANAISAERGGVVAATNTDTSGAGGTGYVVSDGGLLFASGRTGSLSQSGNSLTANGIIFTDG
jgi:hypothetical protein